jgi:hypothetical protein
MGDNPTLSMYGEQVSFIIACTMLAGRSRFFLRQLVTGSTWKLSGMLPLNLHHLLALAPDAVTGDCATVPLPPTTPCDDGKNCTKGDTCDGRGNCMGTPVVCTAPPATQCASPNCSEPNGELPHLQMGFPLFGFTETFIVT